MEDTDKSLIDAHIRGDQTAFRRLVLHHGDGILRYLVHMTGKRDQAEDLFQETFKKVHEKAHTFGGRNLKGWLYTIATNVALDSRRRHRRRPTVSLDQPAACSDGHCQSGAATLADEGAADPAQHVANTEAKEQVRQALQELPERQRMALTLFYYQQLKYTEIAQVLGCSLGTVKAHISRALHKLAGSLPESVGVAK